MGKKQIEQTEPTVFFLEDAALTEALNDRPFGPDGPRVVPLAPELVPGPDSHLTPFGMRILRGIPAKRSIGMRMLAEQLSMLTDWAGYTTAINALRDGGYISVDKNHFISLTAKGRGELAFTVR